MAITGATAEAIVETVLAGSPTGRLTSNVAITLANDAGRHLHNMRRWNWTEVVDTLGLTASQNYVTLASDFHSLVGAPRFTTDAGAYFELVSSNELLSWRALNDTSSGVWFRGAVMWDSTGSGAPSPRLEIHPTPDTTDADALEVWYRRAWFPFPAPADTTAAKIPAPMEPLLIQLLKAFARGWEDDLEHPGKLDEYLAAVELGTTFRAACAWDAGIQPSMGKLTNGFLGARVWTGDRGLDASGPA